MLGGLLGRVSSFARMSGSRSRADLAAEAPEPENVFYFDEQLKQVRRWLAMCWYVDLRLNWGEGIRVGMHRGG